MNSRSTITKRLLGTAGLLALVLALLVAPGGALAHAKLTSSTPADGSTVAPGLTSISMTFGEQLSVTQSTAQLLQSNGSAVAGASSAVDKADRTKMTITTPALTAGNYTVKWHTVTEDDNGIVDGTFAFTVAAGGSAATAGSPSNAGTEQAQTMPTTGGGDTLLVMGSLGVVALLLAAVGLQLRRKASQ